MGQIDVIIAAKNVSPLFQKCLNSLLNQAEIGKIIVVTPHNDVHTQIICSNYPVSVILEPKHYCLAWARKLGVQYCTNEYVCFVDSDIVLGKNHLSQLRDTLERLPPNSSVEGILETHHISKFKLKPQKGSSRKLVKGERGYTHNTLMRKTTLEKWTPQFCFAWEDYLLTQFILQQKGVWYRFQQPAKSFHFWDSIYQKASWSGAGERYIKNHSFLQHIKKSLRLLHQGVQKTIIFRDLRFLINHILMSAGITIGFLKWNKYLVRH